ncbi:MAG: SDR family oxidoreductase [Clostridiales Family XIII bacterium]|jgi:meso-butanediol dehydrogenase/(S,S)-butanediol dehydrogenase/diacetyl reductase|nr:SDR family oxidoreductase [Clostridiales Family XIII bacterium]
MAGRLEGKVAIITGGGVGIGAAVAGAFVKEGAKVLITGRRAEKLEEFAKTLPADSIGWHAGDITKVEDAEAMVQAAVAKFGKLDVLVNNAGIDPSGTVVDIPIQQWLDILNTNLNGTFYMTRFSIPEMLKQGKGAIVNISSLAGVRAIPAMPAYSTTKAGLQGFTNAVALDYGPKGIRVNMVSPGATATDMLKNSMQGLADSQNTDIYGALGILTQFCPLARAAEPEEIAPAVVFLASDESSYITGQNILVDGGATIVDPCGSATSMLGKAWGDR